MAVTYGQLLLGLVVLAVLLAVGYYIVEKIRAGAKNSFSPEQTIHQMLTDLRDSFDRGEIESDEYHRIKGELCTQLRQFMLVKENNRTEAE